jgi:acyl transferase domain-containing protein
MTTNNDLHHDDESVAIIGMAGRYPGAKNVREFWHNLANGLESITFFSDEELLAAGEDPVFIRNRNYVRARGLVHGVDMFDAGFFGMNPREAEIIDPQHRIFLECVWHAFEDAGYDPETIKSRVGVYAGTGVTNYLFQLFSNQELKKYVSGLAIVTSNDKDYVATRVSYKLNLRGPSVTVQTACSTSLVAIVMAAQSVLNYQCDMALAGGVSLRIPEEAGYLYVEGGIQSPDGHCRTFDANAQGTVFSNGAGVVLLKRLSDAIADGDHIYATIRGCAINNDGSRKIGFTAPSVDGQAAVTAESIAMAGIDPETIGYFETHGTATQLGDPIEVAALSKVFRKYTQKRNFCAIGSVKTNIGHTDIAAGAAGLMKMALALKHKTIPESLHFESPNPEIDFEASPFYVATKSEPWQKADGAPRRAGVSSFGVGGTNANVILEEAPEVPAGSPSRQWQLLTLSARSGEALDAATSDLAAHLRKDGAVDVADVAHTLRVGRRGFDERRIVVTSTDVEGTAEALESLPMGRTATGSVVGEAPSVAFMFSGQGNQYVQMARDLYRDEPVFRAELDRCALLLQPHLGGIDIRTLLYPAGDEQAAAAKLAQTAITQPALFVIEYALAQLWMQWGVVPQAMIGHSVGEYVAACLGGVMTLEEALGLIATRGRLMQSLPAGSMTAVLAEEAKVVPYLEPSLSVAAVNGPSVTVVSGETELIEALEQRLQQDKLSFKRLETSHAFHSAMMDPILADFEAAVKRVALQPPAIPFVSNVTGTWITAEEATDPAYWSRHLRSAVRFFDGLSTLMEDASRVYLEVGPGRSLQSAVRQHPKATPKTAIAGSLRHPADAENDVVTLLAGLGRLWIAGVAIDWTAFAAGERRLRVALPGYPFERQRFYIEKVESSASARAAALTKPKADMADWFYVPSYKRTAPASLLPRTEALESNWLFFEDSLGLSLMMKKLLVEQGDRVITVRAGSTFAEVSDRVFEIDPADRTHYERLMTELRDSGRVPTHVAHLWNVATPAPLALDGLDRAQSYGFYSVLYLAQAVIGAKIASPIQVGVVANDMLDVDGGRPVSPEKATLLGPCKVITKEYSSLRCRAIDVVVDLGRLEALAGLLINEITATDVSAVVAYRGQARWIESYEPVRIAGTGAVVPRIREQGTYLITGGMGGIGTVLAEDLARNAKARLVLVGRSALPAREQWSRFTGEDETSRKVKAIQRLEELGAEVLVCSADTANVAEMQAVVTAAEQRFGTIHGIFHAAGVPGGGIVPLKTHESAEAILAPKVRGTLVLDSLFRDKSYDFFVLFSSVTSILGSVGQIDYAAANAFLNAFAQRRYFEGKPVVAVDWDGWQEVGMLANSQRKMYGGSDDAAYEAFDHPLLQRFTIARNEETFVGTLGAAANWTIGDHKVAGTPTLVGTAYIDMARAVAERGANGRHVELRDVYLVAPFMCTSDAARDLRLSVTGSGDAQSFAFRSKSGQDSIEHVMGKIAYREAEPATRHDIAAIIARCKDQSVEQAFPGLAAQESKNTVDVGGRWRNSVRVHVGEGEALALLELPAEYIADLDEFGLHPALMDTATAFAHKYAGEGAFLPFFYKLAVVKGRLPQRVYSHARFEPKGSVAKEVLTFDITITDEQGVELVAIEGYTLKKTSAEVMERAAGALRAHELDPVPAADPGQPGLEQFILPAQGIEAIRRILAGPLVPQVIVSTTDFGYRHERSLATAAGTSEETVSTAASRPSHPRPKLKTEFVAPSNEVEETIAQIWAGVLGIEGIGVNDNFLELGGHSLLAIQVVSRVREAFQVDLPLETIYNEPTVRGISEAIIVALTAQEDAGALEAMLAELEAAEAAEAAPAV